MSPRLRALAARVLWPLCPDNATVMVRMRKDAVAQGLVLFSYGCFAHATNLVGKELCRASFCVGALRAMVEAVVFFRRCTRVRGVLQADRATHAAAGERVGQLVTFSATRWVGQSLTLTSFLENLPGLRRVLLANSHDANGFSVPPAVATAINDGAIKNTLRSLSPCLRLLFRVSASLESDGSPLSAVLGLYSGFCIVLRGETFALPAATRSFLSGLLVSRFSAYSHPLLVLAFYLDRSFFCSLQATRWDRALGGRIPPCFTHSRCAVFGWGGGGLGDGRHEGAGCFLALRGRWGGPDTRGSAAPRHLVVGVRG